MTRITTRPPCGIAHHVHDCACRYDAAGGTWRYDSRCTPLRIAGRPATQRAAYPLTEGTK